jgi:DNA-binding transcriptional LysR family regulator
LHTIAPPSVRLCAESTVSQEIDKKTLVSVKIEDGEFFRPIAAIYKKNRVLSPAMKQFLAILKGTV